MENALPETPTKRVTARGFYLYQRYLVVIRTALNPPRGHSECLYSQRNAHALYHPGVGSVRSGAPSICPYLPRYAGRPLPPHRPSPTSLRPPLPPSLTNGRLTWGYSQPHRRPVLTSMHPLSSVPQQFSKATVWLSPALGFGLGFV